MSDRTARTGLALFIAAFGCVIAAQATVVVAYMTGDAAGPWPPPPAFLALWAGLSALALAGAYPAARYAIPARKEQQ